MTRLTKRQKELKSRYINIKKECGGYRATLSIGCQGFGIENISAGKHDAEWTANMLAIALSNLLEDESS